MISRFDDVKEVLSRHQEFTISEINSSRMQDVDIDFFLGMDASEVHDREKGVMDKITRHQDLHHIQKMLADRAAQIVSSNRNGKIEIVNQLSRVVPLTLIEKYFGVPVQDEKKMQDWMRKLFNQLFLNLNDDPLIANDAQLAALELKNYLMKVISQQRKAGSPFNDTLLTRLLALSKEHDFIDDDFIRRNLSGLMIGAVDTTSKCVVLVLQELSRRPDALMSAIGLAREHQIAALKKCCYEALRFNPHNPIVIRYAREERRIGRNGKHRIPAGSKVAVGIFSAMHDRKAFVDPARFEMNREAEYLHFSLGLHACFGRHINDIQIPEIVAAVLRLRNIRKSSVNNGKVSYDGPFPQEYWMEFDAE